MTIRSITSKYFPFLPIHKIEESFDTFIFVLQGEERHAENRQAPKVDDERDFPSLG